MPTIFLEHGIMAQSSVGKEMVSGTFTHSSQHTTTLKPFIKTYRNVIKSSNPGYSMSFVQGQIL